MWPDLLLAHVRQQPEHEPDRAEVVELDRALVVVEAVVGERDGAPDRAPGVVDQHVDGRRGRRGPAPPARRSSRSRTGRPCRRRPSPPARSISALDLVELLRRARDEQRDAARRGDLQRRRAADAARGAGDQHRLAVDRAGERAVLEQVGVEVALPVVPQLLGVGVERRHLDAGAPQRALRVARVEPRHAAPCARAPRPGSRGRRAACAGRPPAPAASSRRRGRPSAACPSSACRCAATICGAWAARANVFSTSPARCGRGLTRWNACPSRPGSCAMWSIAAATQSTGTMFVQPTSRPTSGNHCGSASARLLDRLEEVVRAVDLVHLARARVADHDRRPVDAPGARRRGCARAARTRTWSGGRARAASGPRRTCPR